MAQEKFFDEDEFVVSKTDAKGIIQYVNDVFLKVAEYSEDELLGKPHNFIRNPTMPKCVFKLLWERIKAGKEIFAYVVNNTKHGDYYWVLAHITPCFDEYGKIIGFHSNRRVPRRDAVDTVKELYKTLLAEESKHGTGKKGMEASYEMLMNLLKEKGVGYDEFVLSI